MSLDFDSAALQMQHEDEEYDPEDYARERELQQLLTDLPHDMLEDSGDHLSNFSDCGTPEEHELVHEPWDQDATIWNDHPVATNVQSDYNQSQNVYAAERFLYDQGNIQGEMHGNDWPGHHSEEEDKSMYEISGRASEDESDDVHIRGDGHNAPNHYQQNHMYHLPENFRPYINGHQQEFNNQHNKIANFVDTKKEHKKFGTSDTTNSQSGEPYKVIYKPYPNNIQQSVPISPDGTRRNEVFEKMQQEFLATAENSSDNMQILQLQVLNKAKERQLEELNKQLEERSQQIRYLSHQLAVVKDEKDGMCLSLQESQKLYQNGKEKEIQLEGQIKAFEIQIQTLTANEAQLVKQAKAAEVAMESLQQQLLELRRSDALLRAREQHETIVAALKQKNEEQVLSLQQKLDAKHSELQEQTELCCHQKEQMKQLERTLEESKLEKTEIINRLSRSLEESQNQCANLLQMGFVQETNQLRIQLQQAQSAQLISNEMNKALQEELKELKEEILLYESAAKHGVFLSDPGGELNVGMTDSYVDLGIKKVNKNTRLHSAGQNKQVDNELSKDEIIFELKAELERLLNSNKSKRNRVSQLQNELKDCERTIEDLKKQQLKTNMHETKARDIESPSYALLSNTEEIMKLKKENQALQEEAKSYSACVQECKENQEKLKKANQDLCNQMRQMVQDSDQDKQEALDRCERLYRQHYEDMKKTYFEELEEKHAAEKEKLIHAYEENVAQLKTEIDELNKEMFSVKECYIAVCKERDEQEAILKAAFEQEQQLKEEKFKKQFLEEKEESLNKLKTELEETYKNYIVTAKNQWQKEQEFETKQHIENEVATIKTCWEREQNEIKDQAIQETEMKWQRRLAQALEETKRNVVESKDCCSQTDQVTIMAEPLSQVIEKAVDKQMSLAQDALKEKENVLREQEARYHENIARQVELALTKARVRWLQELPELAEYKVHLKAAQEKWEKECEIRTAKQVSLTLSAAEEKWKKELENADKARVRTKELEERILSLKRELELKEEEIPAVVKAELAKAQTQWNKEKQEEVLRIQHQNEEDYHSFLHDHKNKINEVLAKAKEEFAKQKQELLDQKEAELKVCLARQQQEWAVHETKRFQNEVRQYEDRILVQVELLLDEMHKDLIKCASDERTWRAKWNAVAPGEINPPFKEKLKFCLQKAYRGTVYAILEKAKQEWNEKHEDLNHNGNDQEHSYIRSGEEETGDKARPSMFDLGKQVELQRILRKQPALQETEMDFDSKCKRRGLLSQADSCCEHCRQQLERKERECQDLKKKLDKACRHLQLAVKEQKAKSEEVQENEKIGDENSSIKNKSEDLKPCHIPPRASSEGSISETFVSCDGKALEEMRSQYIKAVGKIKSDMVRYVRESKERAAEIIKAEVLRERQETARKMRKYYLICLQQLLIDDGKHEGLSHGCNNTGDERERFNTESMNLQKIMDPILSNFPVLKQLQCNFEPGKNRTFENLPWVSHRAEKKIICAAGKLATMAKILETPVRNTAQSKASHSALSQFSTSGPEEPKRNCLYPPGPAPTESQIHGESIRQKNSNSASQKRIPCCLRQRLDAESQPARTSSTQVGGRSFKQLGDTSGGAELLLANSEDKNADRDPLHSANIAILQNPLLHTSQVKPRNIQPDSSTSPSSNSGISRVKLLSHNERPDMNEPGCILSTRHRKTVCEKPQALEIQETPVRDEGSSTEWSLVSETLPLDSNDAFLYPVQKTNSSTQVGSCEQFPMTDPFSYTKEDASVLGQQAGSYKDKAILKSQVTNYSKGHLTVNPSHVPHPNTNKLSPASAQQSGAGLCPTFGKSYHLLRSRKQVQDTKAFQQDSGFESPQINFD